ncbi:MAG: response regulator transcription factor [Spirochaetia bacterium]
MAYLLIVDDDADFAAALRTVLKKQGHMISVETDYRRTSERIQEDRPDLVILDVIFPENDKAGFETARAIRKTFGELPVILLTAVNQSFPLGFSSKDLDPTWLPAVDFVEKPVDFSLLSAKVSEILAHGKGAPGGPA